MASSQDLRSALISATGYETVYIQPPVNSLMTYPCVLVQQSAADVKRADNIAYDVIMRYTVTRISKKYDNGEFIRTCLASFGHCYYDRSYVADGLYHDVLYIYY